MKRIKFIIRGDAGEYETDQGEDADALCQLIEEITSARILLVCKTPDGVEHMLSDTRDERYFCQRSCDECGWKTLCIQQSRESVNEALNRYLYDGGAP